MGLGRFELNKKSACQRSFLNLCFFVQHRPYGKFNFMVPRAPANIGFKPFFNDGVICVRAVFNQQMAVHDKTRRAAAALKSKMTDKGDRCVLQPFNWHSAASMRHDFIGRLFTLTVQAPQSPFKQPGFAPVNPSLPPEHI